MNTQEFIESVESLRGDMLQQARRYLHDTDDAEDAVQESLVKLWTLRDRIPDKQKMRNMAAVICRNVSLNMIRDSRHTVDIDNVRAMHMRGDPQMQMEENEDMRRLRQSIQALSDKQRAILRMRNVENMSYADISRITGSTESSVRGMLSKARQILLEKMKGTTE
ncbi:MAG: sigma-70 family RNA polymerase sigma factor [bacterium]|nr:sigma-70 family RNA polymerase sigma factor [bacterium]